ncbi:hypothetical protein F5888DRAFT_604610 [Russula emetica]|nr:hypothetical protein F5888DRAFT_604610 [Russula emetica]
MLASLNLFALPEDIILEILEDADYRAILACKRTCRWMHDIISRSTSLRYLLELVANGMQHGSRSPSFGKVQCLEMLAAHETAWRTLLWTGSASVDTIIGLGEPVSVSWNVLCFRTSSGMPRNELLLLRAPSKLRNVVGKTWRIQLPHDTQDVCIDAAQDLLICRWFKSFRVYSLSLGRSHPLAQHVGIINATNTWRYRIGSMRVCGDNFAAACEQGLYISVWNWKSGEHISDFMALLRTPVFTFLDEYHILFPGWTGDSIYVYDVRAMPPINTKRTKLKGTHCFEMPISQLWGHELEPVYSIALDCNSLSTGIDSDSETARAVRPGLFWTNPHDRVVSLRIIAELNPTSMHDANWWRDYREIHAHAQTLLMWTQARPAPPDACFVVPWSEWGPAAARVVPSRMDDDSDVVNMCRSQSRFSGCGMRIVSTPSVRSDGITSVTVTDYHPTRVIRGRKQDSVLHHTNATPTEIEENSGQMREVADSDAGRRDRYSPPQELEEASISHVSQIAARKMEYLEKDIPLPEEFRIGASQPVFNVLCEDAIMFYTIVPETNTIQYAHWYTF